MIDGLWTIAVICVVSLSVAIIFASYALHVQYRPFLEHNDELLLDEATSGLATATTQTIATIIYVCHALLLHFAVSAPVLPLDSLKQSCLLLAL
jgi:hypothetical protein